MVGATVMAPNLFGCDPNLAMLTSGIATFGAILLWPLLGSKRLA